ncbi:FGGY-family carbohydrate kinase [Aeribacillus pallidus]|uniref:FGGY-family carbohydrate kinase n=1 Tax=Aeribacillus pallidus TaxID=33936 RepID=UPI001F5D90A0|nr:FGGY-family carbohydrate kinase [Aeribacillus pallidus]
MAEVDEMNKSQPIFIGIDIGTQGIRTIAIGYNGTIYAASTVTFNLAKGNELRMEQSPFMWWQHTAESIRQVANSLKEQKILNQVVSLSVTSTSGTVIPLDKQYEPLYNALMYSDSRSASEAALCREAAFAAGHYTAFSSSYGLPKIVWFHKHFPQIAKDVCLWAHPTDYIIGKLTGKWGITDYTSAFKSGYDLNNEKWPEYIEKTLKIPVKLLPIVLPSGTFAGNVSKECMEETGLPENVSVTLGLTDGCASQFASGSLSPGNWNTTIGTTLVIKGITYEPIIDEKGILYNHRHPDGYWMPGGASNTGGDWISIDYSKDELAYLNSKAYEYFPSRWISYPLRQKGERFPFAFPDIQGFDEPGLTKEQLFISRLEGVAYLERMAYEMIEKLSSEKVRAVFTAGGGSSSDVWLTIRSNVLKKPIIKMKHSDGAIGAAIVAAASYFGSIQEAGENMLKREKEVMFEEHISEQYEEGYERFIQALKKRGVVL